MSEISEYGRAFVRLRKAAEASGRKVWAVIVPADASYSELGLGRLKPEQEFGNQAASSTPKDMAEAATHLEELGVNPSPSTAPQEGDD